MLLRIVDVILFLRVFVGKFWRNSRWMGPCFGGPFYLPQEKEACHVVCVYGVICSRGSYVALTFFFVVFGVVFACY